MSWRTFAGSALRAHRDWLIPLTVLVVLLSAGLVHGRLCHRWKGSDELATAASRLALLPKSIGDWSSADLVKDAQELAIAEAAGYLMRRYQHQPSGEEVIVLVLCGRPGPIAVHPPTACYRARGYHQIAEHRLDDVRDAHGQAHQFLLAEFLNPATLADDRVAIMWAWSTDGRWQTPADPRWEFADEAHLYKLYVTWNRTHDDCVLKDRLPTRFIAPFLEECSRYLGSANKPDVPASEFP